MLITLDEATEQLLQRELDRGHFVDANDLITHALQLVQAKEAEQLASPEMEDWLTRNREAIRADIEEASAQDERGEGFSLEDVTEQLRSRLAARAA